MVRGAQALGAAAAAAETLTWCLRTLAARANTYGERDRRRRRKRRKALKNL